MDYVAVMLRWQSCWHLTDAMACAMYTDAMPCATCTRSELHDIKFDHGVMLQECADFVAGQPVSLHRPQSPASPTPLYCRPPGGWCATFWP